MSEGQGNLWWIQARLEDLDIKEKRASQKESLDAMQRVQEFLDRELSGRGHG